MLWTLITGLIVGAIAKLLTPGRSPGGFFITICIGIGGSILAREADPAPDAAEAAPTRRRRDVPRVARRGSTSRRRPRSWPADHRS